MSGKNKWFKRILQLVGVIVVLTAIQLYFVWQEKRGVHLRAEIEQTKRAQELLQREMLVLEHRQNFLTRRERLDSIAVGRGLAYGDAVIIVPAAEWNQ